MTSLIRVLTLLLITSFLVALPAAHAQGQVQVLESPTPQSDGRFGWDLATDGSVLLVGAMDEAFGHGRAHIYQKHAQGSVGWDYVAELISPGTGGRFGQAVEQQDSTFMISGSHYTNTHVGDGLVYCYDLSVPSVPVLTQVLYPSVSTTFTSFGVVMASSPRWLAVSAIYGSGPTTSEAGVVYIFEKQQGLWVEKYRVEASDGAYNDKFGAHLAIDGDRLLVHAHSTYFQGVKTGAVYLFELGDTAATQIRRFDREHIPPGIPASPSFPHRMHLEGNEVVLVDLESRCGIRYVRNSSTGHWDWVESSAGMQSMDAYPSGITPPGVYIVAYRGAEHDIGFRTIHRTDGVWETCGKKLMPPASLPSPAIGTGFVLEFAADQAFAGSVLYPPPAFGNTTTSGAVFIYDVDPDFFDPGNCFTGGKVFCTPDVGGGAFPCPCGSLPAHGRVGCENSTGEGGKLRGMGDASYEFQSMRLQASQLPPGTPVLFSWALKSSVAPAQAGAGVHCLGGQLLGRVLTAADSTGMATIDNPMLPQPMAPLLGAFVAYQAFYRDPPTATCRHSFNVTNAWSLILRP